MYKMKITSLVDNISKNALNSEHGLCLYIELDTGIKILFDFGQTALFHDNSQKLGLNINDINIAILSHGHYDHGGGISTFLDNNTSAPIFVREEAFNTHYSLKSFGLKDISIDKTLIKEKRDRFIFCDDIHRINKNLTLFTTSNHSICFPKGNRLLFAFDKTDNDNFNHEQSILIEENDKRVLIAGCAHSGIVNIINRAEEIISKPLTHIFAGMHLQKSGLTEDRENKFIDNLSSELKKHNKCHFYTMHCTGEKGFHMLKQRLGSQIDYLSCGDNILI